jgi:putative transposase
MAERQEILDYVAYAKQEKVSERTVCTFLCITCKTLRKGSARYVKHRLTLEEENALYHEATSERFKDLTPEQIVAILAYENNYIASESTLYRLLRKKEALAHRQETKKPCETRLHIPLMVTCPNQVWSWDITWLNTDVKGIYKYAYSIIDLFDRTIVGWSVEDYESDAYATKLFAHVCRDQRVTPQIIHADNGNAMRGVSLAAFLDNLMVSRSYSRPRVSNDNAFIESWHKTLKYTVGYPKFFYSLIHAREWFADFVHWYNVTAP